MLPEISSLARIQTAKERKKSLKESKKNKVKRDIEETTLLKELSQPGYYVIHTNVGVSFENLQTEEAVTKFYENPNVVSMKMVDVLAKIEYVDEIKDENGKVISSLKAASEAYARCGTTFAGVFAEVGVSGDVTVTFNGKVVEYSAKLYFEAKLAAEAGPFGASASASAEAGAEHNVTVKTPEFGNFAIYPFFTIKGFLKAEAKAGAGLVVKDGKGTIEAEASLFAGIGLSATLGAKLLHKGVGETEEERQKLNPVGALSGEGTIQVGAGAGGSFKVAFILKEETMDDVPMVNFGFDMSFEVGLGPDVGVGFVGSLKVAKATVEEGVEKLKGLLKELVEKVLKDKIKEELLKIKDEYDHLKRKASEQIHRLTDNTRNYATKALVRIESLVGAKHVAFNTEIRRHVGKLQHYKSEVEATILKLQDKQGISEEGIQLILGSVESEELKDVVEEFLRTAETHTEEDRIKRLQLLSEKYNRRILKLETYIREHFEKSIEELNAISLSKTTALGKLEEALNLLDSEEAVKDPKKTRKALNDMIDEVNKYIGECNTMLKLMNELETEHHKAFFRDQELRDEYLDETPESTSEIDSMIETIREISFEVEAVKELLNSVRDRLS